MITEKISALEAVNYGNNHTSHKGYHPKNELHIFRSFNQFGSSLSALFQDFSESQKIY